MHFRKPLTILSFFILALSSFNCSSSSDTEKPEVKKVEKAANINPCDVLTEALIKGHFETGEIAINQETSEHFGNKLCTYIWDKANKEEIEAEYQEVMMQYISDKAAGKDVKIPIMQTTNRVVLTINTPIAESKEAALANFHSAMSVLTTGITVEVAGKEHTTKPKELVPVSGIGDKANWIPSLNEVSAVGKNTIFHVTVETGDKEENKAKAIEIAKEVLKSL